MQIEAQHLSKRYNREWIFRDLSHQFEKNSRTGIIGSNGSGKSTLLKILSAAELPSEGKLIYNTVNGLLKHEAVYKHLSFASPYMDLPEQLNPVELYQFHSTFKPFQKQLSLDGFLKLVYLMDAKDKAIKYFSSGMKQRLKLGLAICSTSSLLILDEPCSNLDKAGIELYWKLLKEYSEERTILIGSNEQSDELQNIDTFINLLDYK